jgi:hypothetical protein
MPRSHASSFPSRAGGVNCPPAAAARSHSAPPEHRRHVDALPQQQKVSCGPAPRGPQSTSKAEASADEATRASPSHRTPPNGIPTALSPAMAALTAEQREVVKRVLAWDDYVLVMGFPGTGKTSTICALALVPPFPVRIVQQSRNVFLIALSACFWCTLFPSADELCLRSGSMRNGKRLCMAGLRRPRYHASSCLHP